jgi:hypothetical protein
MWFRCCVFFIVDYFFKLHPALRCSYAWLKTRGVTHIAFMGGATNQCILNREFGASYFCHPASVPGRLTLF